MRISGLANSVIEAESDANIASNSVQTRANGVHSLLSVLGRDSLCPGYTNVRGCCVQIVWRKCEDKFVLGASGIGFLVKLNGSV